MEENEYRMMSPDFTSADTETEVSLRPKTLDDYIGQEKVKENLKTPFVRVCGDINRKISRVAVGGGACDDLIPNAIEMGADVMITSDMKYHISADSVDKGICVIDAGHYPTEVFVIDIYDHFILCNTICRSESSASASVARRTLSADSRRQALLLFG